VTGYCRVVGHRASVVGHLSIMKVEMDTVTSSSYYHRNREKISQYHKKRYQQNRKKLIAYSKKRYILRKKDILLKIKEYYKINRRKCNRAAKKWHQENKEKAKRIQQRYRSRHKNSIKVYDQSYHKLNKEHCYKYKNEWRSRNKHKTKNEKLKSRFGITIENFNRILDQQKNKCGICGSTFVDKKNDPSQPCVDHNHLTLKVRGILCRKCNGGLGGFNDDKKTLEAAFQYLRTNRVSI
jgi:hypothetical protein